VLAAVNTVPTYIFDEVDAGVGGKAAVEVGRRLHALAKDAQVIVVTHLAQVAVWADHHLVVRKSEGGMVSISDVISLTSEERSTEIARMLSGQEGSQTAIEHARELLEMVQESVIS
jgi:DNA repair protein RecN (Recombination protein N)